MKIEYFSKYDMNDIHEQNRKEHINELVDFIDSNIKSLSFEEVEKYIKQLKDLCERYRSMRNYE